SWHVRPYNKGNTCTSRLGNWSFWAGEWPSSVEDELADGEDFEVFPNPLQGRHAYIYSKQQVQDINVKLFNAFGQQIFNKNLSFISGTNHINLSDYNLPPGFYNLVFNNKETNYVRK
ncbi:T9SS type A sorting domain-containing protein, partial [Arthrospira platensis SPKY1]|nr:T9SS type A sorting domain-containing protein [Arthrospira platensis SPKY1]